jgi:hypothetical protein
MRRTHLSDINPVTQQLSAEWSRLICKLRWIGLDEEARCLERAISTVPRQGRGRVSEGPLETD